MGDSESARDRTIGFLFAAHGRIAEFARENYDAEGRGVVRIDIPLSRAVTALVATNQVYHTLNGIRRLTANLEGSGRTEADVLIRMIETYDPAKQAVVTAALEGENPITITMKLEAPGGG